MNTRPSIHAYINQEAHDKWHDIAAAEGVSISALIQHLPDFLNEFAGNHATDELVKSARRTDAARRRRK